MFNWLKKRRDAKDKQILQELEEALEANEEKVQQSILRLYLIGIMSRVGDVLGEDVTVGEAMEFIDSAVNEKITYFSQQPQGRQTRERWANQINAKERN